MVGLLCSHLPTSRGKMGKRHGALELEQKPKSRHSIPGQLRLWELGGPWPAAPLTLTSFCTVRTIPAPF